MTLLIPLLLRLTSLFERGVHVEEVVDEETGHTEATLTIDPDKE